MNALPWIRLHMRLECKGIDEQNQLFRIPCANPDDMSRVYVARHPGGDSIFFEVGLPEMLRERLLQLPVRDFFESPERVKAILEADGPCESIHIGKSYLFPETLSSAEYPDVLRLSRLDQAEARHLDPNFDPQGLEVFAIVVDNQIASACVSSREDDLAGEAWVWTLDAYRRCGFARQVTAAWAHDLQQRGKTPFYSHKMENLGSQAVARSLGLIQYIEDAGYE